MTETAPYAVLVDGLPPVGAEIHMLFMRGEPDANYRSIRVTRDNGSVWYCRAVVPSCGCASECGAPPVGPLPDGRHFTAGFSIVDRNDPKRAEWIGMVDRIEWSEDRGQVFLFAGNVVRAYGPGEARWSCRLPGAIPDDFMLFDFMHDGVLQVTARHETQHDAKGEPVFFKYSIDLADGSIRKQWLDELQPETTV